MSPLALDSYGSPIGALVLFFAFAIGHWLCDFPLQGQFLALSKERDYWRKDRPEGFTKNAWVWCLTAHAAIHAGAVWVLTGCPLLGLCEFILHWFIDLGKGEGRTSFNLDQSMHLACKVFYVGLLYFGIGALGA